MDNPDMTIEEYVQYETEKAFRNNQVYNWEIGKLLIYDEALRLDFSSEPTLSSQHVDEVNWKNKTSLSKYDDENYNVISKRKALKKQFSKKENFDILSIDTDLFSVNDLKLDKDNDEDKIGIEQSSGDIFIELLRNIINIDVRTYAQGSNELWKTSHDTISEFFTIETFIKEFRI
ncbi:hypothetical protein Tco_1131078 [Tanacetum coccineum]